MWRRGNESNYFNEKTKNGSVLIPLGLCWCPVKKLTFVFSSVAAFRVGNKQQDNKSRGVWKVNMARIGF